MLKLNRVYTGNNITQVILDDDDDVGCMLLLSDFSKDLHFALHFYCLFCLKAHCIFLRFFDGTVFYHSIIVNVVI